MHKSSCSCDHHYQPPNSFSMLFNMPPYHQHICPYSSSSSSSGSVDCTLSLATPAASSRLNGENDYELPEYSRSSSRFCWDFLQPDNGNSTAPPSHKSNRGGATVNSSGSESLLARRCANCDTTSTPLWRNGPRGPKSLCNACGIRFKKEERRAAATVATTVVGGGGDATEGYNQNSWMHKMPASCYSPAAVGSEFRFRDDVDDRDSTFLSWRLNVTDRAGLVHDFTRY